jgi:hypothetical protein
VGQLNQIVLRVVALRQGIHAFAKQFDHLVADLPLVAPIEQLGCQRLGQAEALVDFSQQQRSRIAWSTDPRSHAP